MKLDFVDQGLEPEELHDLLELAVNGEIREPTSALGEHITSTGPSSSAPPTAASCTGSAGSSSAAPGSTSGSRRASSTSSSTRTRHTFGYVQPDRDAEPIELSREPSWAGLAYRR